MSKQHIINYYKNKFVSEHFVFSVIFGFWIIGIVGGFLFSLVMSFFVEWWWKLTLCSVGFGLASLWILKIKVDNWMEKQLTKK